LFISKADDYSMLTGIIGIDDHKLIQELNLTVWQPC